MNLIKYKNKNLYNLDTLAYTNLKEVSKAIQLGAQIKATCFVTKSDITDKIKYDAKVAAKRAQFAE